MRIWRGHAAWIAPGDGRRSGDQVVVFDVTSHTARSVAQVPPGHVVSGVAGDEGVVVFTELLRTPTDADPTINWTIKKVDLDSGGVSTLASSTGPVDSDLAPTPAVRVPWVAWAEPIPAAAGQRVDSTVVTYDIASGRRFVLNSPAGNSGQVAFAGTTVIFDHNQVTDRHTYDIYARAADGSSPSVQLTHNGSYSQPFAGDGWIGWLAPSNGYASVVLMNYGPNTSRPGNTFDVDPRSEGNARLGKGFVMWPTFGGPLVLEPLPPDASATSVTIQSRDTLGPLGDWDAWENAIAWVTKTDGRSVVNFATVSIG